MPDYVNAERLVITVRILCNRRRHLHYASETCRYPACGCGSGDSFSPGIPDGATDILAALDRYDAERARKGVTETPFFPVMHIHAQASWHDDAMIVGNRPALRALLATIAQALEGNKTDMDAFCADGESYAVKVRLLDMPLNAKGWEQERLPYTAPEAREPSDG